MAAQPALDAADLCRNTGATSWVPFELGVSLLQLGCHLWAVSSSASVMSRSLVISGQQPSEAASRSTMSFADGEGDAVVGAGGVAVAGVRPGAAAVLLPQRHFDLLGDLEGDPAGGAGPLECGDGDGLFGRGACLDPGLRARRVLR